MPSGVIDLFSQLADNDYGFFQKTTGLIDIMSTDLKRLTLDDTFADAVELFRRNQIHHAPVVADDGDVVGVVSDRDLLRNRPPMLGSAAEGDDDHLALKTTVSQLMTRGTIAVSIKDSPIDALSKMLDHHVDCVLVHDESNALKGILTPTDFIKMILLFHRVCSHGPDLVRFRLVDLDLKRGLPLDVIFSRGTRSVRDVMTKNVKTVAEADTVASAMELMQSLKVRHLPVVDENSRWVGMVSDRDILKYLPLPVPRADPSSTTSFRDRLFAVQDERQLEQRVASIMEKKPPFVQADSLFTDVIDMFMKEAIGGVVVLDDDKQLCGILTTTDVLRVFQITLQIGSMLSDSDGSQLA